MQKQTAPDPPIVDSSAGHMGNVPKASPGPLASSALTTKSASKIKKRRIKLQDPDKFINGKDEDLVEYWLAQMRGKMAANNNLYDTLARCIVYVMNQTSGTAFGHLELQSQPEATRQWKDADKMLTYLEHMFGDSNRCANAKTKFRVLYQKSKDFNIFWAEFQRLSVELDCNEATLISDFTLKLTYKMQRQLSTGNKEPTYLLRYAERYQRVLQCLKNAVDTKTASEKYAEKQATAISAAFAPKKLA